MTSGSFHAVPLSSISVNREERQRRDLLGLDELSDSIRRLGLIHPIVVTRDLNLVAGERRLEACRILGWTHINCQYVDELDSYTLRAIELEENVKRKDLSWQDECRTIREYHEFRKAEMPGWTLEATADELGYSLGKIVERIQVAKAIETDDRVAAAPVFSTARGIVQRAQERANDKALMDLRGLGGVPAGPAKTESILVADFLKWAPSYTGPKFNFIHCDFPYGIGADKFNQGAADTHGGYKDSEEHYWDCCSALAGNINKLCSESCHFLFWFSMQYYRETLDFFYRFGLFFDPYPLIWIKSDNVGILPDPTRGPRRIYETAFFGSLGDRKIVSAVSNAFAHPTDRSIHMSAKPVGMLQHFFRMFVDSSTVFLDPTCGSGSSLRAAEGLGARHVLGLEVNEEFAGKAREELTKARRAKSHDERTA